MRLIASVYNPQTEEFTERLFKVRRDAKVETKCKAAIAALKEPFGFVKFKYKKYGILTDGIGELFLYGIDSEGKETKVDMYTIENEPYFC